MAKAILSKKAAREAAEFNANVKTAHRLIKKASDWNKPKNAALKAWAIKMKKKYGL